MSIKRLAISTLASLAPCSIPRFQTKMPLVISIKNRHYPPLIPSTYLFLFYQLITLRNKSNRQAIANSAF